MAQRDLARDKKLFFYRYKDLKATEPWTAAQAIVDNQEHSRASKRGAGKSFAVRHELGMGLPLT